MAGLVVFVQQGCRTNASAVSHRCCSTSEGSAIRSSSARLRDPRSSRQTSTAFLAALAIEQATVVGHSIRQLCCAPRRHRVSGAGRTLVLIGSGWLGSNDVTREVHASLKRPVRIRSRASSLGISRRARRLRRCLKSFSIRIVTESLKLPARLWAELLGGVISYDDVNEVGRIAVSTLLLWGDRDALFPREDQDRLVEAIPRRGCKIYPEIGHCPNWECPDEVARDLVTFLRRDHTRA